MNRGLVFFLGMLFGVIFFFAAIAVGGYVFVANTSANQLVGGLDYYAGDLAKESILMAIKDIVDLYTKTDENGNSLYHVTEPDADGNYYSISDFEAQFNVNLTDALPFVTDNVKKMPLFTLFTEDGMNKVFEQTPTAAVTDIVNGLSGDGLFADELSDELAKYPLSQFIESPLDTLTDVQINWLVPSLAENDSKLLVALGQCKVGGFLGGDEGDSILKKIKTSEKLSPLGQLEITELIPTAEDSLLANLFEGKKIADLIDDDGNISAEDLLEGVYLGSLLDNERKAVDKANYVSTPYKQEGDVIILRGISGGDYVYAKSTDGGSTYYEAEFACTDEANHTAEEDHTVACWRFTWYDKNGNACDEVSQLLSNFTITDLTATDDFMSLFGDLTIRDVLGDSAVSSGILSTIADIRLSELSTEMNNIMVGELLQYKLTDTVDDVTTYTVEKVRSSDGKTIVKTNGPAYVKTLDGGETWHEAHRTCDPTDTEHECTSACYSIWKKSDDSPVEGVILILTDKTIGQLSDLDLNSEVNNLTLRDVLGESATNSGIMKLLANTKIGNISAKINQLYIGQIMDYEMYEVDVSAYSDVAGADGVKNSGSLYAKKYNDKWYEAELYCTNSAHTTDHTADCFRYVWYQEVGGVKTEVDNMKNTISNLTVQSLGSTDFVALFGGLTLRDVLGESNTNSGILKLLTDTKISGMNAALDALYVGEILDYAISEEVPSANVGATYTVPVVSIDTNGDDVADTDIVMSDVAGTAFVKSLDNGETWYKAKRTHGTPEEDHKCSSICYTVWTDSSSEDVSGVILLLADKKLGDLEQLNMDKEIKQLTLRDVLGDAATNSGIMKWLANTKIGDISTKINQLYIGQVLSYEMKDKVNKTQSEINALYTIDVVSVDTNGDDVADTAVVKTDGSGHYVKSLDNGTTWYEAEKLCDHDYTDGECKTKCYSVWKDGGGNAVKGINNMVADKTVSGLASDGIGSMVNELTLRDVLGDTVTSNAILSELADCEIQNLASEMNNVMLGVVLGLLKMPVDATSASTIYTNTVISGSVLSDSGNTKYARINNGSWYEADLTCTESHTHTESCYTFVWYETDTESNYTSGTLFDGKVKYKYDGSVYTYIMTPDEGEHWYVAKASDNATLASSIGDLSYVAASAFNQKIANLKLNEVTSDTITNIVVNMKVGEMIDSGLLSLDETKMSTALQIKQGASYNSNWRNEYTITQVISILIS